VVAKSPRQRVKHPYVTRKTSISGGKPIIAGTRVKVAQVAIEYEHMRLTPDEIIRAHPHLTLAQVYDALAYYYENAGDINADNRNEEELVQSIQAEYSHSVLEGRRGGGQNLHR
jgi:uncharacterized protein (DUF433 family)